MDKCYKHGIICHPEPLFFGGEGSPKTQSEGFFGLAKNASLQNDIHGIKSEAGSRNLSNHLKSCILGID